VQADALIHWDAPKDQDYDSCDALSAVASTGIPRIVRVILSRHPNVNWSNPNGETALMNAVRDAAARTDKDRDFASVVQLLIAAGANVNLRNQSDQSAIMMVTQDAGIVRALLAAGAKDINRKAFGGTTRPMEVYDADVAQALLEGGADP
jgi:ankyrin repeat protein